VLKFQNSKFTHKNSNRQRSVKEMNRASNIKSNKPSPTVNRRQEVISWSNSTAAFVWIDLALMLSQRGRWHTG